jgi:hypothetical protein
MKRRKDRLPPKKPRTKKIGKTAIRLVDANKDKPATIGHDERLQAYIKRAMELKILDYTHFEIAQKMFEEFKMERIPSITTVHRWIEQGYQKTDEDIKHMQWSFRLQQMERLERLVSKFLPIALCDELEIRRWVNTKEGPQPTIDENAIGEQLKAGELALKIMARQGRLFGFDVESLPKDMEGVGDLQSMQIWIVNHIAKMAAPIKGKVIEQDPDRPVLELESGLDM